MNLANKSVASGAGNIHGQAIRQQTPDANVDNTVPPAAQLPVSSIRTPTQPIGLSLAGTGLQELAVAIEGFDNSLSKRFDAAQDQWRLNGQLAYQQGKTEKEITAEGNFYTVQGWQSMNMRASMAQWVTDQQENITQSAHQVDPTVYRKTLMDSWAKANAGITDPVLKKYNAQLGESYFPQLIEQQTQANAAWKIDQTKTAYGNLLDSVSKQVDPNNPQATIDNIKAVGAPGTSSLKQADENEVVTNSIVAGLNNDRDALFNALGGVEGMKERGATPAQIEQITRARGGFFDRGGAAVAKASQNTLNTIKANAGNDGNATKAGEDFNVWASNLKTNPYSWQLSATQVNPSDLNIGLMASQPDPDKRAAVFAIMSDQENLKSVGQLQALRAGGKLTVAEYDQKVTELATKLGVTPEDVKATAGALNDTMDKQIEQAAGEINSTLAAKYAKDAKKAEINTAIYNGTAMYLSEGDKQTAAKTYANILGGEAQTLIAKGELPVVNGDVRGAAEDYVEQHMLPWLSKQHIVYNDNKQAISAALGRNIIDSKGNVDTNALAAYDQLNRMHNVYGYSKGEVDQYLEGPAKDLFYQAQVYDQYGMDSATALKTAYEDMQKPETEKMFSAPGKDFSDTVKNVVSAGLDSDQGFWNKNFGNNVDHEYHRSDELDAAKNDSTLLSTVYNTALVYKSNNSRLSDKAAIQKAWADVSSRSAYISGKVILTDKGRSVAEDMGLQNTGEMNHEQLAVLTYLRDFGSDPVKGFGKAWDQFKVAGTDPYSSWLYNHTPGLGPSQLLDSVRSLNSGYQPFQVWYDPNNKLFRFQMFTDASHQDVGGKIMEVPADVIGKYYLMKNNGQPSSFGKWFSQNVAPIAQGQLQKIQQPVQPGNVIVTPDQNIQNLIPHP